MALKGQTSSFNQRNARIGGSKFTIFRWNSQPLLFARQVSHTSPAPVGPGATPIQPMDALRPTEIITPVAIGMGQLTLELYETYNRKAWDDLIEFATPTDKTAPKLNDLADIFLFMADRNSPISVEKFVHAPGKAGNVTYTETYNNCVITNMMDGETIEIGTMEVLKQITLAYTHVTRSDGTAKISRAENGLKPEDADVPGRYAD